MSSLWLQPARRHERRPGRRRKTRVPVKAWRGLAIVVSQSNTTTTCDLALGAHIGSSRAKLSPTASLSSLKPPATAITRFRELWIVARWLARPGLVTGHRAECGHSASAQGRAGHRAGGRSSRRKRASGGPARPRCVPSPHRQLADRFSTHRPIHPEPREVRERPRVVERLTLPYPPKMHTSSPRRTAVCAHPRTGLHGHRLPAVGAASERQHVDVVGEPSVPFGNSPKPPNSTARSPPSAVRVAPLLRRSLTRRGARRLRPSRDAPP